jgi:hypothetical protein
MDALRRYSFFRQAVTLSAALCIASVVFGGSLCWGKTDSEGASKPATKVKPYMEKIGGHYPDGYSVRGPISVMKLDPDGLILRGAVKPVFVKLKGKSLIVKNEQAQQISKDNIKEGSRIYVCIKGSKVIVYLLDKPKATTAKPQH